jgi:hypothetical protein
MKNAKRTIAFIFAISLLGCNSNVNHNHSEEKPSVEINGLEKYETLFNDLNEYLSKKNGKLWGHQLYGPILLVNEETREIFANEADSADILTKDGSIYTGKLPKEMNISNTALNWNGKRWTMVVLPLPEDNSERLSILIHELFHRIQPKIGFSNLQPKPCKHLNTFKGRVYLKLELEALRKALSSNNHDAQMKHVQNAIMFRLFRYELFQGAKESENALEFNEGIAEYTGTILSNWNDKELRKHYIQAIDNLYENRTFVRSFAYRTIPVYGYFMKQKNEYWNKEIITKDDLTDFMIEQFNIEIPVDLEKTVTRIRGDYPYQSIIEFETERELKHKQVLAELEKKFQVNPVLVVPVVSMNFQFNPGNLIPFKDIGTVYPNLRVSDSWGILTVEQDALIEKDWSKITVSKPTDITDKIIKGDGWKLELDASWKLDKTGKNYTLVKK